MSQNTSSSPPEAARESGSRVAGVAAGQAREVASEARDQARNLTEQGADQLREQARTSQRKAAENLHGIADQLQEMSDRQDQSGVASDMVREVAQRAKKVASWLDAREPGDLVEELRGFARRKPGLFLAGAAAAGLLAGRLTRGVAAGSASQGGTAPEPRMPTETAAPPSTGSPVPTPAPDAPPPAGYRGQHRAGAS
ncbi:hypothetical protein [Amycolatopsis thermophila]|uniref:Uncharacterized protein n=1 Tax=Amycolatopsis thermophila TaxID=206084 RepID=A0ABU0EQR1_9PSEU|nr:hypothetical protein [Amycolatopsis thermophila]MDQ0377624.1 hypothetical protein [Amycolatopsis thermophila]